MLHAVTGTVNSAGSCMGMLVKLCVQAYVYYIQPTMRCKIRYRYVTHVTATFVNCSVYLCGIMYDIIVTCVTKVVLYTANGTARCCLHVTYVTCNACLHTISRMLP